jgi:SAM-dependent methyltransferase
MLRNPKVVRGRKYVHRSALADLEPDERQLVNAAAKLIELHDWDVARVDPQGSVMLGRTTNWERSNPELKESWLFRGGEVTHRTYRAGVRPKYHKTALMMRPNPGIGEGGTAMARNGPSAPARFLFDEGLIRGPVLDFGSGVGEDATWLRKQGLTVTEYDPNFEGVDRMPKGKFATVLCIYVLNVLPKKHEAKLLKQLRARLRSGGEAYVAVRADVARAGETSRGYQRPVRLKDEQLAGAPSGARIYVLGRPGRMRPNSGGLFDDAFGDVEEPQELPVGWDVESNLHEYPSMQSDLLKPTAGIEPQAAFLFTKARAWMVKTDAAGPKEAEKIGRRARRNLIGKRSLNASQPYLHALDLYVAYPGGHVLLAGKR